MAMRRSRTLTTMAIRQIQHYKEDLWVHEEFHPYAKDLNEKIIKESSDFRWFEHNDPLMKNIDGTFTNVKALQTSGMPTKCGKNLSLLNEWILNIISVKGLAGGINMFTPSIWLSRYNEGDFTVPHYHVPCSYAFVYFVKSPKGSSPLDLSTSGKKIKAEEGKVVIFPGFMRHHVPKNKCKDRITAAGNIIPIGVVGPDSRL